MELHIENNVLLGFKRDGNMWLPEHLKDRAEAVFRDVYPEVEYIYY